MLKVNVGGREDHMNPWPDRRLERLRRAFNVMPRSPSQSRDNRPWYCSRNRLHCREVAIRSDRKASLDHVNAEPVELPPQPNFLLHVHAAAGRLLTVTKRGVKNRDSFAFHGTLQSLISLDLKGLTVEREIYNSCG